ncbi:hypothetical protein [Ferruginibacter sp. HRS2-29]|uniref:hypothetical protein n=1 Tax=Ferruginibacter sp. HRS2-29 TaxID=2487334 RepID=UPI0020CD7917|nr:hypothetical protein [Ferruginibacter sp. HRS2-29]MCP9750003.1 hypothetical protein [Ferruginibacter sp. HRS2-29]
MKKIIVIISLVLGIISCKKNDDTSPDSTPTTSVSVSTLMGSTGKRWPFVDITLTYYSASGSVDSTVIIDRPTSGSLFFGDNNGVNGINLNFDAQDPLTRVLPGFGAFSLNQATQKISFTCLPPHCNGTDGEWAISSYNLNTGLRLESLQLQRSVSLAGNRKVTQLIKLLIY